MPDLLTELEPADEERYKLYLSELRNFDLSNACRRDFFRHMGRIEGHNSYEIAGTFLRKYRPMFEAAVPAWAAKANHKLRESWARKKGLPAREPAAAEEDELDEKPKIDTHVKPESDRGDTDDLDETEDLTGPPRPPRGISPEWRPRRGKRRRVTTATGDDDEDSDGSFFEVVESTPKRKQPTPITVRSASSSAAPSAHETPATPAQNRAAHRANSVVSAAAAAAAAAAEAPYPRPLGPPPPNTPACNDACAACVAKGFGRVSHGRLRFLLHEAEASQRAADTQHTADEAQRKDLEGQIARLTAEVLDLHRTLNAMYRAGAGPNGTPPAPSRSA